MLDFDSDYVLEKKKIGVLNNENITIPEERQRE